MTGYIVVCGCGTTYWTEDPALLVCPNPACDWDFGPWLESTAAPAAGVAGQHPAPRARG